MFMELPLGHSNRHKDHPFSEVYRLTILTDLPATRSQQLEYYTLVDVQAVKDKIDSHPQRLTATRTYCTRPSLSTNSSNNKNKNKNDKNNKNKKNIFVEMKIIVFYLPTLESLFTSLRTYISHKGDSRQLMSTCLVISCTFGKELE